MLLRFFHKNRRIMHEQFQTQIKITAKPQISGLIRKNNAGRPGGLVSSRARAHSSSGSGRLQRLVEWAQTARCVWIARRGKAKPLLAARRLWRSSTSHGHRLPPRRARAAAVAAGTGTPETCPCSRLRPFAAARSLCRCLCRPARPRTLPRGPRARRCLHHGRRPGPPPEGDRPLIPT